jgi:hypothetical protein
VVEGKQLVIAAPHKGDGFVKVFDGVSRAHREGGIRYLTKTKSQLTCRGPLEIVIEGTPPESSR